MGEGGGIYFERESQGLIFLEYSKTVLVLSNKLTKWKKIQASLFFSALFTYPSCLLDGGACVMTEVGEGRVG